MVTTDQEKPTCIACGKGIPAVAVLCSECGSYQAAWRNHLRFWATVSAVVAVGISAVGFLAANGPAIRKALFWRESVTLVYYQTRQSLVLSNEGDEAVFVSYALFQMKKEPPWTREDVDINAVVEPGHFHVWAPNREIAHYQERLAPFRNLSERQFFAEIDRSIADKECYEAIFHDPVSLRRFQISAGQNLNVLPAYGVVFYRPASSEQIREKSVEAKMTLWRVLIPSCAKKYGRDWESASVRLGAPGSQ